MISNLQNWLEVFLFTLGLWGILIVLIFAFFHPSLEFPAAIFLFFLMVGFTQSLMLSILLLMLAHTGGFALTYYLFRKVPLFNPRHPNMVNLLQRAKHWYTNKAEWQHILVMSLPLVYTYPLRFYWTKQQSSFFTYLIKMVLMYSLLYLWNVLLYQWIQDITSESPSILISIFFFCFAVMIYRVRKVL
jgi:hypothetical protein